MTTDTLLLFAAICCLAADALGVQSRVNLQSLGLLLFVLTFLT